MKSKVFVGSSVEGLPVAYAIQEELEWDAEVTVWPQGIFKLSGNALDDLIRILARADYGVFVFSPDDVIKLRDRQFLSVRDNVIFELGLFIGRLGKERCFFVAPKNVANFHLPTDLLGTTPGRYDAERSDNNLRAALGPICNQMRKTIKELGATGGDSAPTDIMMQPNKNAFLTINSCPLLGQAGAIWRAPYGQYRTVAALLNDIWSAMGKLPPYSYRKQWLLRDQASGALYHEIGTPPSHDGATEADERSLLEVGIVPGMTLEVVPCAAK